MSLIASSIPSISITPPPPEKNYPEPYSPIPPTKSDVDDDGYRSRWLSLPPLTNTSLWRYSSPLCPIDSPPQKGVGRDQIRLLLRVSRDQRAKAEMQGMSDSRKEVALDNQKLKQFDRRAVFLSKVKEPSFVATATAPIPDDTRYPISPHRIESDFPVLGTGNPEDLYVRPELDEQVERGLPIAKLRMNPKPPLTTKTSARFPPSLDEITTRLKPMGATFKRECSQSRLPSFLTPLSFPPGSKGNQNKTVLTQYPDPCILKLGPRCLVIPRMTSLAV